MTEWQGFLKESKKYMNYPENKWRFWRRFPGALVHFSFCPIRDLIRGIRLKIEMKLDPLVGGG